MIDIATADIYLADSNSWLALSDEVKTTMLQLAESVLKARGYVLTTDTHMLALARYAGYLVKNANDEGAVKSEKLGSWAVSYTHNNFDGFLPRLVLALLGEKDDLSSGGGLLSDC